jgi:Zn finger protein HypA/HybF involved in hydrogenase expression
MVKLKCQRCKHEWEYQGSKLKEKVDYPLFVQCPKCRTSVKLTKEGKK